MQAKYVGASDEQVKWGGGQDPRGVLEEGKRYQVLCVHRYSWHTKIELVGITGKFNSVCFELQGE